MEPLTSFEVQTAISALNLGPSLEDIEFASPSESHEYWRGRKEDELDQSGSISFQKTSTLQLTLREEEQRIKERDRLIKKMNAWRKVATKTPTPTKPKLQVSTAGKSSANVASASASTSSELSRLEVNKHVY